ncbi:hypothetical protein HIM_06938 [Hirsutella minnesotensis 3608]|uniref:Uncharacterized protein n=1 Tax=Hirsutella minnesotensis 3608 TaxID=1043627 RepID=A0A0F7ZNE4_9HYPO|nr:hypothetical protein HIM_06938 [Hirsutella minnesotensis 3608]
MASSEGLEPPPETNAADPGARQLSESSDDDDRFTDAQSGPVSPGCLSPIPTTRVEKVDNDPCYGEVPGTEAHQMREKDAKPDQIAVFAEEDDPVTPLANGGNQVMETGDSSEAEGVPLTVLEGAPDAGNQSYSEEFEAKRVADAIPDVKITPEGHVLNNNDDFGDDFDDFEEGGQDDDFDDFEDGFQATPLPSAAPPALPVQPCILPFPIPDFDGLGADDILSSVEPYLDALFPPDEIDCPTPRPLPKDVSIFMTPRAAPLWSQLVAPPPLAPPDWIRSRTRRLFLVSLGVPVDLDEILPASKQKKLILPSLSIPANSPRTSSDSRSATRLRQGDANASSTSVDTQGKASGSRSRKGPPPQPELDLVAARYLCTTTDEALNGMTNEELKEHVTKLESMQDAAKEMLEYWQKRTDEKIGDREAFEGVIENLVKHARKVRK